MAQQLSVGGSEGTGTKDKVILTIRPPWAKGMIIIIIIMIIIILTIIYQNI